MKKMKLALICSLCTLSLTAIPVHAVSSDLNASEIRERAAISPQTQTNVSDVLSNEISERQNAVSYALSDQPNADGDPGDFTGYNASGGYAVHPVSIYDLTVHAPETAFQNALASEPLYMIPFNNAAGRGTAWMHRDADGKMGVSMSVQSDFADFDFESIAQIASQLEDVTEIKLMQDWTCCLNLVYVKTDSNAYIIPYTIGEPVRQMYGEDLPTALYQASDFAEWVNQAFDWNVTPGTYGGIPYVGYPAVPFQPEEKSKGVSTPLTAAAVVSFAAGTGLASCAVINHTKRKKKMIPAN